MNLNSPLPGSTEWADGHNDKRQHVIEDIAYRGDQNWITCRCGSYLMGTTPELLARAWQAHGGSLLDTSRWAERIPLWERPSDERASMALISIAELGARCTCGTTDVADCPNYLPGDEAPDAFEKDEDE